MPFLLLCVLFFQSCAKHPALPASQQVRAETVQTDQGDGEILRIAEDARRTLPIFFRHLTRAGAGDNSFCIKHPFRADDGSGVAMEQLWLTGVHFRNGEYYGILANTPVHIDGMKKGDTVIFDVETVTDWMYIRDGKIAGGLSIRYLLEKIPESQRSEQQWEMLLLFE